jgi:hypothetical protein
MKKIIVTIELNEKKDEDDPEYTYISFSKLSAESDLTKEQAESLTEGWCQSDWLYIDFPAKLLNAIDKSGNG